jgi:O-antigen/teichoic acid export membrane protein
MRNLSQLKNHINILKQKPIFKDALWLITSKGIGLILQASYFVIIARTLGVEKYGEFISITALVAIVFPFAGLGTEILMLKNVAKDRSLFAVYWGNSLLVTVVTAAILITLAVILAPFLLHQSISPLAILIVAVSDLFFGSITSLASRVFQSIDRLNISARISIFIMFNKVLAAIGLSIFFPNPNDLEWIWVYSASSVISALVAAILVQRLVGSPALKLARIKSELTEGISFSISSSAYTIYSDIDKTMLAKLSTLKATGIYASAYRLIDVAFIPVISIAGAAYADFFRKGKNGVGAALTFAKPLVAITATYSVLAGVGLILIAPFVPNVLGNEYLPVVEALRWLAPIPLFRAMQHFGGDILSGSGFQNWRSATETSIAVLNIGINLWLIPLYSWRGAAWASLASDGLLMLLLWLLVSCFYWKQMSQPNLK